MENKNFIGIGIILIGIGIIMFSLSLFYIGDKGQEVQLRTLELQELQINRDYYYENEIARIKYNQTFNLSMELAEQKGRADEWKHSFKSLAESSMRQSEFIDNITSDYFEMKQEKHGLNFQLTLCKAGVNNWEEYVEKYYGNN